jgi:hypothetical protein
LSLSAAYRLAAEHLYRDLGRFAYAGWDFINPTYFDGRLPETLILWDIIEYGHLWGWCRSPSDGPPIIKLHPSLVKPADPREPPWDIPLAHLGYPFAFDVLLHECIHASVNYLLGGWEKLLDRRSYWSSHNNPLWVAEVNRIAPMLGYRGDAFTMNLPARVQTGETTKTGKPVTRTVRQQAGNAPCFEHFPHSLPGRNDFYVTKELPFAWQPKNRDCVGQLADTGRSA